MGELHEKVFGDDKAEGAREALQEYYRHVDPELARAKRELGEAKGQTRRAEEAKMLVWGRLGEAPQEDARRRTRGIRRGAARGTSRRGETFSSIAEQPTRYKVKMPGKGPTVRWREGEDPDIRGALESYGRGGYEADPRDVEVQWLIDEVGPTAAKLIHETWGHKAEYDRSYKDALLDPKYNIEGDPKGAKVRDKIYGQIIDEYKEHLGRRGVDSEEKTKINNIIKQLAAARKKGDTEKADKIVWDQLLPELRKIPEADAGMEIIRKRGGILQEHKGAYETKHRLGAEPYADAILASPQGRMVSRLTREAQELLEGRGDLYSNLTQAMFGGVTDQLAASQRQLSEEIRTGMAAGGDARNQAIRMATKIRAQENINKAAMQQLREGNTNLMVWARDNARAQIAFNQMWIQGLPLTSTGYTATMSNLHNLQSTAILPAVAGVAGTGLQAGMNIAAYEQAQSNFWSDMIRGMVASNMSRGFGLISGQMG